MLGSGFSAIDISSSGLAAERFRMEVIANNIANANSTQSVDGGPYRRQQVVFAANLQEQIGKLTPSSFHGVQVLGVQSDPSDLIYVHDPSHPHANDEGMVAMPNVSIPNEMVDLITATRSYEANLTAIRSYQEMAQQTLSILRGIG